MQILKLSIMLSALIITHATIPMDNPMSKVVEYFVTNDRLQCRMCAYSTRLIKQCDFIYHLARHLPLRLQCLDCNNPQGSLKKLHRHFTEHPLCNLTSDHKKTRRDIKKIRVKSAHERAVNLYCTALLHIGIQENGYDSDSDFEETNSSHEE